VTKYLWFSTATNPEGGLRYGWKLHVVEVREGQTILDAIHKLALCDLFPKYGWVVELFTEDESKRCKRCVAKLASLTTQLKGGDAPLTRS
jgi:hypothetical protein